MALTRWVSLLRHQKTAHRTILPRKCPGKRILIPVFRITDGEIIPSAAKHTRFGSVASSLTRTFTIEHSGPGPLSISSITLTGENASEFFVSGAPSSVPPNSSATFNVTYSPSSGVSTSRSTVTINSNDTNEAAYEFIVEGEGALSPAGSDWTARTAPYNSPWQCVAYGNGRFAALATVDNAWSSMVSNDGVNWTASMLGKAQNWLSMTYGNGLFVAVTNSGPQTRAMSSPDGINWTARTAPEANTWFSVTFGGGRFVAVALDGTNRVMTGSDGVAWAARSADQGNAWCSVTYGNGLFVAVSNSGTNRAMTSPDGVTGTSQPATEASPWQTVAYGNGRFVAVANSGTRRIMTSTASAAGPVADWAAASGLTGSNALQRRRAQPPQIRLQHPDRRPGTLATPALHPAACPRSPRLPTASRASSASSSSAAATAP